MPLARGQLIAWAAAVHQPGPDRPLGEALDDEVAAGCPTTPAAEGRPAAGGAVHRPSPSDLSERIARVLQQAERSRTRAHRRTCRAIRPDHGWELWMDLPHEDVLADINRRVRTCSATFEEI